jgi:hypothetical protein
MKRVFAFLLSISLISATTACTSANPEITENTAPELTGEQISAIMRNCVQIHGDRVDSGETLFTPGYLDTTMAILSDCVESANSQLACGKNSQEITVCGIRGRQTGYSFW